MTTMTIARRATTLVLACSLAGSLSACANAGVSDVLGAVLGGGQGTANQVSGTVDGLDTRNQRLVLTQSNGQQVSLAYDNQTQVVYNNQNYAVTNLERGDRVTARIQDAGNGNYYTDLVQVDQSVSSSTSGTGTGDANVQSFSGTVRQIDRTNGLFTLDTGGGVITVALPYNVSRSDESTFQNLRAGDRVRIYGVYVNNSRVELRQFY